MTVAGTLHRTKSQPGPAEAERIKSVEARGRSFEFTLEPGLALLDAVGRGFAAEGFASGVVEFGTLALEPFAYVMPALSKTPDFTAFYSEPFRPLGVSRLVDGAMTFGTRDGAPFFHCHALWHEADGRLTGGHILPTHETVVAEPARVTAFGIDGAMFDGSQCRETNFRLFEPFPAASLGAPTNRRCFALRVRPNVDLVLALEQFCAGQSIRSARIRGGVGSTIEARFNDHAAVTNFATEVYVSDGRIAVDGTSRIAAALVDYTGGVARGVLTRGDNPVLMTFELVLVEEPVGDA
jgi:predicted DNA-binding protein with PD1-like motif